MGQPVKLSGELVNDARATADLSQRSIAGQIEFWAQIGRAVEPLLRGDRLLALRQSGAVRSLVDAIAEVDSAVGKKRVRDYLKQRPYPHFEEAPGQPGLLCKIDEDGTRTIGRFVDRRFVAHET